MQKRISFFLLVIFFLGAVPLQPIFAESSQGAPQNQLKPQELKSTPSVNAAPLQKSENVKQESAKAGKNENQTNAANQDSGVALDALKAAISNIKKEQEKAYTISATNSAYSKYYFDPTETYKLDPLKNIPGLRGDFQVSQFSGAASYNYAFDLPPGRAGIQPSFTLSYNNYDRRPDSIVGLGWNIETGYIVRNLRRGINLGAYDYYDFITNIWGEAVEIEPVSVYYNYATPNAYGHAIGTYGAKVETDFKKYEYKLDMSWIVTDKDGVKYTFGNTDKTRQYNLSSQEIYPKGSWGSMYKWMLTKVEDANGNTMTFEYTDDFLPLEINYTGRFSEKGPVTVKFVYAQRSDKQVSYKTGFPIETTKILNKIQVFVSDVLRREYQLFYKNPPDGIKFSLLSAIREIGWNVNGEQTVYPDLKFEYKGQSPSWSFVPSYKEGMPLVGDGQYQALRMGDINGDSLPDFMNLYQETYNKPLKRDIFLNNGTRWVRDDTWTFSDEGALFGYAGDNSGMLIDLNGDMRDDVVYGGGGGIYLNTGSKGFEWTQWWNIPDYTNQGGKFLDVNADGFQDYLYGKDYGGGVKVNNGKMISTVDSWIVPIAITDSFYRDLGVRFGDVNGDGLPDIIKSEEYENEPSRNTKAVYLNTGKGWTKLADERWTPPVWFSSAGIGHQPYSNGMVIDVNADGLSDILYYPGHDQSWSKVYMNDGIGGWVDMTNDWRIPFSHLWRSPNMSQTSVNITDINGDGIVDYVNNDYYYNQGRTDTVYVSNGDQTIYYLNNIDNSLGLSISVEYARAQPMKNKFMPFPVHPVSKVVIQDGAGSAITKTYKHEDGFYYYTPSRIFLKEFVGFAYTEEEISSQSNPTITKRYFHQSEGSTDGSSKGEYNDHVSKKGRLYREEIWGKNKSGVLVKYKQTINKWDKKSLPVNPDGADRSHVFLASSVEFDFNPKNQNEVKAKAVNFSYDNYGNVTEEAKFGEVSANTESGAFEDIDQDSLIANREYIYSGQNNLNGYMKREEMKDKTGKKLAERRLYYDNLGFGSVSKGNITREEKWLNLPLEKYAGKDYVYDDYGNAVKITDERGNTMNAVFDSVMHFYPIQVQNAKGHTTSAGYDIAHGSPLEIVDANGYAKSYKYDGLGRVKEAYIPDLTAVNPRQARILRSRYTYNDVWSAQSLSSISAEEIDPQEPAQFKKSATYIDGMSRVVQVRLQADKDAMKPQGVTVNDKRYNEKGEVGVESYPYYASGFAFLSPYKNFQPSRSFAYDALGRISEEKGRFGGDVTTSYASRSITQKNAKGAEKIVVKDAYGRVVSVTEHNNGEKYTTLYTYDLLGALINIQDAQGNVRNFAYDSIGRKLSQENIHAPSAGDVPKWFYQYDDAGNMIQQTNPSGQITRYAYDELNRVIAEDYTGKAGTEVIYAYDNLASNGIGRADKVDGEHFKTVYSYDGHGSISQEDKTIDGVLYQTRWVYDNADRVKILRYPEGGEARYAYDKGGRVVSVTWNNNNQDTLAVSDILYTPLGQKKFAQKGNGVKEEYAYSSDAPWRILSKTTTNPAGGKLQAYTYQYDAVDNIVRIADSSNTSAYKTVNYEYDDLNRLKRAYTLDAKNVTVKDWAFQDIAVQSSNYDTAYAYNSIGDILLKADVGSYIYGDLRHPSAVTKAGSIAQNNKEYILTYDVGGNMISQVYRRMFNEALKEKIMNFTYDYNGRMTQSASSDGLLTEYWYDSGRSRIAKITGGAKKVYIGKHFEKDASGSKKYILEKDDVVAVIENAP